MSLLPALAQRARRRVAAGAALITLAVAIAVAALAWRIWDVSAAAALFALMAAGSVLLARPRVRRHDSAWAVRQLDASRRDLEDSSGLLLSPAPALGPLQQLQRARMAQRLRDVPPPDLRPAWPWRIVILTWLVAALAVAWATLWPRQGEVSVPSTVAAPRAGAVAAPPELVSATLRVAPPAYTGIAASEGGQLDVAAPTGSRLRWSLRFAPQPAAAALETHDGRRIALSRDGDDWVVETRLQASMLYRIVVADEVARGRLHRVDAVPDLPPRARMRIPERGLTLADPPPSAWTLSFEAEDDHGLATDARLLVTRTEGTGENIRFHEHAIAVRGQGERRQLRFDARIDPARYGLQRGEDLIVRLEVRDNRAPDAQTGRSASAILRWPEREVLGADGLEGLAREVLPAYFRSQRQIIIDAEALLKDKPRLAADAFAARSDGIGVDQRLLRLRYGQFLGEESEGGARALPTSDLPTSDAAQARDHDHAPADAHDHDDHGHGAAAGRAPAEGFGDATGIIEAFGHIHDLPEAATLLDPKTRETLRKALREMWQSELHLRQAAPQDALPYAHRALEFIKEVQQADRIYLQRVGSQLPPIDEARRLGGKRDGIAPRSLPPAPSPADDPLQTAWRALDDGRDTAPATLDALQARADANAARIADPLALIAAVDALRIDPGCAACRDDLRAVLWAAMRRPAGGVLPRSTGDAAGARYLERLDVELPEVGRSDVGRAGGAEATR